MNKESITQFDGQKIMQLIESFRIQIQQLEPEADDLRVYDTIVMVAAAFGASIANQTPDPLQTAQQFGETLTANIERLLAGIKIDIN